MAGVQVVPRVLDGSSRGAGRHLDVEISVCICACASVCVHVFACVIVQQQ